VAGSPVRNRGTGGWKLQEATLEVLPAEDRPLPHRAIAKLDKEATHRTVLLVPVQDTNCQNAERPEMPDRRRRPEMTDRRRHAGRCRLSESLEHCLGGLSSADTPDESTRPLVYRENDVSLILLSSSLFISIFQHNRGSTSSRDARCGRSSRKPSGRRSGR
jgi:hypothetical protein